MLRKAEGRSVFVRTAQVPRRLLASIALGALVLSGCGSDTAAPIDILSTPGWPGALANSHNSSYTDVTGSRALSLAWSRPLGASTSTRATVGPSGQITLTVAPNESNGGCVVASFQDESGRKRFCNGLGPSAVSSSPVSDTVSNLYVGDDGAMTSLNEHGQERWRTPVYGVPRAPQFTPDGRLLVVTQFGQINVLSTQTGVADAPIFDLVPPPTALNSPDTSLLPADAGLATCINGGPDCPVASSPAFDLDKSIFYVVLWRPGAIAPQLVALKYTGGDSPSVAEAWSSPLLAASSTSSPVLSSDGSTIYLTDVEGTVRAYDTEKGNEKWAYFAGHRATASPAVTPDGLIVPPGGDGAHLLALRDAGDRPEVAWEREDVVQLGAPALTAGNTGYTVTGTSNALTVTTFDSENGSTLKTVDLPGAVGYSPGVSIGPNGEVVVPTVLGQVFLLR
ncbi:PQQ-binding-like beta-propeller repeat protein [Actinomycetes bacterium M1A6_2h]